MQIFTGMELLLSVISILLILSVLISLVRNDFWIFKVFEYPRLQKLFLIIIITGCWAFFWPFDTNFQRVLAAALVLCICYLLYKIIPYTSLYKKELKRCSTGNKDAELKIFAANVLQDNTQYQVMLQQIEAMNPDIIFLLETNRAWEEGMAKLETNYPYQLKAPLENTYGLLFYSRFSLKDAKVSYLVKDDIPSIETTLVLPSGAEMKIWGLHPEPPVPGENLFSTAKDKELMKVALAVRDCSLPVLVFGDLNDVAWSHTTELFRKTSGLLDPRRGRGFYSTFSAHHWFIRFPLDYVFCSEHFGLINMKRMPPNGSDHFATFTHLVLAPEMKQRQEAPTAGKHDLKEAHELADQSVAKHS